MLVCDRCFESKENCKCNMPYFVDIDNGILPIIKDLNNKGYKTIFCCEGHVERVIFDLYIYFRDNYNFNTFPKGCKVESKGKIIRYVSGQKEEGKTKKRTMLKKYAMENLRKWVNNLEPIEEK